MISSCHLNILYFTFYNVQMFLLILARGVHVNECIFNRTNHVILDCLMKNLHLELLNQQICKIKNEKLDCETIFSFVSVT